jgi:hypothetical protein
MIEPDPFRDILSRYNFEERRHFFNPIRSNEEYLANLRWVQKRFQERWPQWRSKALSDGSDYFIRMMCGLQEELLISELTYTRILFARNEAIRDLAVINSARLFLPAEYGLVSVYDRGTTKVIEDICAFWENFKLPAGALLAAIVTEDELVERDEEFLGKIRVHSL